MQSEQAVFERESKRSYGVCYPRHEREYRCGVIQRRTILGAQALNKSKQPIRLAGLLAIGYVNQISF